MGVTLLFMLAMAQAPQSPRDSGDLENATISAVRPVIVSLEVRLPKSVDKKLVDKIPSLTTLRKGQPLSIRSVQRTIENIYATRKFSDVKVLSSEVAGGVTLVIALLPIESIAEIYVEGNRALTKNELIAVSRLPLLSEYWPERAENAAAQIQNYYHRKGYRTARVTTQIHSVESGISLGIVVDEGPPTIITALHFPPDLDVSFAKQFRLTVGALADEEEAVASAKGLEESLHAALFLRARVEPPVVDDTGTVTIESELGPRYRLRFSGNRHVSSPALTAIVALQNDEVFEESIKARCISRLAKFYRFQGFRDVQIRVAETISVDEKQAELRFIIEERSPIVVTDILFPGLTRTATKRELIDVLAAVMERAAPAPNLLVHSSDDPIGEESQTSFPTAAHVPRPSLETVLVDEVWADAAKSMTSLLRERGYLKAAVKLKAIEIENQKARVSFQVNEGARGIVRNVSISGLETLTEVKSVVALKAGDTIGPSTIDEARTALVRALQRRGYLFADSTGEISLTDDGTQIDCRFDVQTGPQVKVRSIIPVGATRTLDEVILREATMVEGTPLDSESLFQTQSNLATLGIFSSAQVELLAPERPEPLKTVLLKVKESSPAPEIGFGYFLAQGPRALGEFSLLNLWGRAINLSIRAQASLFFLSAPARLNLFDVSDLPLQQQIEGRANVSLQSRSLLPANINFHFDALGERVFRPQFRFTRVAGGPNFEWTRTFEILGIDWLRSKVSLALQYELEWSNVEATRSQVNSQLPVSLVDQERLRFRLGTFALQSGRFSPTLDFRDNALNPHRGLLIQGNFELTSALFAQDESNRPVTVSFAKASALISAYFPIGKSVVAVSGRTGRIFPLINGSSTPPVKRFFMGGASSIRGFNEDQLLAVETREQYRKEVADCQSSPIPDGCSVAAQTIAGGRQMPSQGGELFLLGKAEFRFPAFNSIDLALFLEAGNLWLAEPKNYFDLRTVTGLGLRYNTPVGPLAVDVGYNLTAERTINEPLVVVHFNIGVF
jgi:outer membrane protein insertion porin family